MRQDRRFSESDRRRPLRLFIQIRLLETDFLFYQIGCRVLIFVNFSGIRIPENVVFAVCELVNACFSCRKLLLVSYIDRDGRTQAVFVLIGVD